MTVGTVSISTAARLTGHAPRTLRRWCAAAEIPAHRPHDRGQWRVSMRWVQAERAALEGTAAKESVKSAKSAHGREQRC